jgi:hypothetical protein
MSKQIIQALKQLKSIKPTNQYKQKLRARLEIYEPQVAASYSLSSFAFRVAFLAVLAFVFTGTTVGVVAGKSQPGDQLYPIKEIVKEVAANLGITEVPTYSPTPALISSEPESTPSPEPEISPSPESTPSAKENKKEEKADQRDHEVLGITSENNIEKPNHATFIPGQWDEQIRSWVFEKLSLKEVARHPLKDQVETDVINKPIKKD